MRGNSFRRTPRTISVAAAAVAVLGLAGCGIDDTEPGTSVSSSPTTSMTTSETTTTTVESTTTSEAPTFTDYEDPITPDLTTPPVPAYTPPPTPAFTPPPEPAYTPPPPAEGGSQYFANCSAARAAGQAPLYRGDPGYSSKLDRDGDGVACES